MYSVSLSLDSTRFGASSLRHPQESSLLSISLYNNNLHLKLCSVRYTMRRLTVITPEDDANYKRRNASSQGTDKYYINRVVKIWLKNK
jgi:hypothetical protein